MTQALRPEPRSPGAADDRTISIVERRRAQQLLIIFGRLGAAVSEALKARVHPALTSNVEVLVIVTLDVLGPQRPSDVLALTGLSSGGVTKVLDRLEGHGIIVREYGRVAGDRRGTRLLLTDEGKRVARDLAAGLLDRMDAIRQAVDDLRGVVEPEG